jgi:hypothetical protein
MSECVKLQRNGDIEKEYRIQNPEFRSEDQEYRIQNAIDGGTGD